MIDTKHSRSEKWLLGIITACLSLLLLEGGVRLLEVFFLHTRSEQTYASGSTPFVDYRNMRPLFEIQNLNGESHYVRTRYHPFVSKTLHFPATKSNSTFRVFCLGGSAAMGWPHDLSLSYPAFLQRQLECLYPDRKIEVINAAASTYASYRVKTLFDEIVNYEPDLILIYSGNNEFLERVLYQTHDFLASPWRHIATVRTLHRTFKGLRKTKPRIDLDNYQPSFMIDIALGNSSPLKTSRQQLTQVKAHYRYNLSEMVRQAKVRKIAIGLLNVPVNIKDWTPHASVHATGTNLSAWQEAYRQAITAYENCQFEQAASAFRRCVELDTAYAKCYFYLGRSLLEMGKQAEAGQAFLHALQKDAYPFRALQDFNQIIEEVAVRMEVLQVDIVSELKAKTTDHILGEEVLIDHVHPTVASNEFIAKVVLNRVQRTGLLPAVSDSAQVSLQTPGPQPPGDSLSVFQHLFLIYRVLLQFDKLARLQTDLEALPASVQSSTRYLVLRDELNRYLKTALPYSHLIRARETGLADSLYQPEEARMIIQNYIRLSRNNLTQNMLDETFETFLPQ